MLSFDGIVNCIKAAFVSSVPDKGTDNSLKTA